MALEEAVSRHASTVVLDADEPYYRRVLNFYSTYAMEACEVSSLVNSYVNDGPEVIAQ